MKPTTITEKLLFSTIRLETSQGVGTDFYFLFELDDNKKYLYLLPKSML